MATTRAEKKERTRQRNAQLREERKVAKQRYALEGKKFADRLREHLLNCGLTKRQISQLAGLDFSTVDKFLRGYDISIKSDTIVALADVAGFDVKFVRKEPQNDKFRSSRRLPPPEIPK